MNNKKWVFLIEIAGEEIKFFAKARFGRELTDIELNRIEQAWWDHDSVFDARNKFIHRVIEYALDTKWTDWSQVDEDYLKTNL